MKTTDDITLLRQYTDKSSDDAFGELVARHVNLVYSVALRHVGNHPQAEEITQAVFIILARKARSLLNATALSGWLYQTTKLTAANSRRAGIRRAHREQEAYMQSLLDRPAAEAWPQIVLQLDAAMGTLNAKERDAIVLRFFEGRSLQDVGVAFGASENAATKRVSRALEKMRRFFSKRGTIRSAAVIAGAMSENAIQAAPTGLAVSVAATAAKGTVVPASTLALVQGTLKLMVWMKIRFALGLGTALLLIGGLTALALSGNQGEGRFSMLGSKPLSRAAAELSVTGSFTIDAAHAPPAHSHVDGTFSVSCKDGQWIIRSKRSDQTTDYEEDGQDGRYVYSLTSMEAWAKSRREAGLQVGVNTMEGEITPGRFPFNSPEMNRVLWLLYASSSYLSEMHLIKRLPPIASFSGRHAYLYGFQQPATWRLAGTSPPLPAFVVIYDDGRLRYWEDEGEGFMTGPPLERNWRAPYDKGFTNAVLTVESFSEQGSHRIPQKATFSVYMPKPDGTNAQDLQLCTRFSICASNVCFHTAVTDFKPEVRGSVLVADRRFERDKPPIYVFSYLADKRWLSDAEARQRPEFLRSKQDQAITVSASRASTRRRVQR